VKEGRKPGDKKIGGWEEWKERKEGKEEKEGWKDGRMEGNMHKCISANMHKRKWGFTFHAIRITHYALRFTFHVSRIILLLPFSVTYDIFMRL